MNENSLKNLKPPFSKENQPEENGRPKGSLSLTTILKRMIENGEVEMKVKKKKKVDGKWVEYFDTVRISPELLHSGVLKKACAGNTRAYELIMDRVEGLPKQELKHSGEIGTYDVIIDGKAKTED